MLTKWTRIPSVSFGDLKMFQGLWFLGTITGMRLRRDLMGFGKLTIYSLQCALDGDIGLYKLNIIINIIINYNN